MNDSRPSAEPPDDGSADEGLRPSSAPGESRPCDATPPTAASSSADKTSPVPVPPGADLIPGAPDSPTREFPPSVPPSTPQSPDGDIPAAEPSGRDQTKPPSGNAPDAPTREFLPKPQGADDDATPTKSRSPDEGARTEDYDPTRIVAEFDLPKKLGPYEILEELGGGSFGKVVKAFDPRFDRFVAIKIPRPGLSRSNVENFYKEAKRLAKLSHKGIVKVLDFGEFDGYCYIVTEFLNGLSLRDWLDQNRPTWQRAVSIAIDIAEALAHAHAREIIHRDIKPENIILIDDVDPVLVDFGLSLTPEDDPSDEIHWVKGTPQYMSPEQYAGMGHRVDGRSDIFSLSIVLYEMLCGKRPFRGPTLNDLKRQICHEDPQPIRQLCDVSADLANAVNKALSKDYRDRHSTARDMAQALLDILDGPRSKGKDRERRYVTVLYARLKLNSSASPAERLDIEQQDELKVEAHRLCCELASSLEALVIPSLNDVLLACFGFPKALEDSPCRAVRAGLEIQRKVAALNDSWRTRHGVALEVRLAIDTGWAVVGENNFGGGKSYSLTGVPVAIAEHVQQTSDPNGVTITAKTSDLLKGQFCCESLGRRSIDGLSEPLELLRVTGETATSVDWETLGDVYIDPMVGRESEFNRLREEWSLALENVGRVVHLTGEAGLGKSRLTSALRHHVRTDTPGRQPKIITWRGAAQFQNTGFHAVNDWFQQQLGFERGQPETQRLERLEAFLGQHHLGPPQYVVPLLASLLSIPYEDRYKPLELSETGKRQKTLDLLVNGLLGQTADGPLLFIVEDLHWVDPSTLELLSLLIERMPHRPVLAVLTLRSEFTAPWKDSSVHTTISLTRLGKSQVTEMIRHRTGCREIPAEVVEQLYERTNGVPLFVEEYTRMLLDGGRVKTSQGRLELTDASALQAIPNTLQDLLTARLDRLTCDPNVIQLAAAVGREVGVDLLRSTCDLDEGQLNRELDKLVAAEILGRRGHGARCIYQFKHNLLQEAAYQLMLKKKRQSVHERIANELSSKFPDRVATHPELLAHHYTEAGLSSRAIPRWREAGALSQRRSANREAIEHFRRGVELLDNTPAGRERDMTELNIRVPLGVVLMAARGYAATEVGECFRRARELAESLGETVQLFHVLRGTWTWRLLRDELDICTELALDAVNLAERPEGESFRTEAYFLPGNTAYYLGNFAESLAYLRKGFARFDLERSKQEMQSIGLNCGVTYLGQMALALWQLGFPDQALARAEESVQLAEQLKHPFSLAFAIYHRRRVQQYARLESAVAASVERELALASEQKFLFREAQALMCKGKVLIRQGKLTEAAEHLERGVSLYQAGSARMSLTHHFSHVADAYLDAGQLDLADRTLERAFAIMERSTERYLEAELYRIRGAVLLARPSPDVTAAEQWLTKALETARRQQARSRELRIALTWARWLIKCGRHDEAQKLVRPIYDQFTEGFTMPDLIEAQDLLNEPRSKAVSREP